MIHIPDSFLPRNEQGQVICSQCKKVVPDCDCPSFDPTKPKTDQFFPKLTLDRKGRQGKAVIVISQLPRDQKYLKDLARTIKSRTGSGGTFYCDDNGGVIEVQGQQVKLVEEVLREERFQIKE